MFSLCEETLLDMNLTQKILDFPSKLKCRSILQFNFDQEKSIFPKKGIRNFSGLAGLLGKASGAWSKGLGFRV